LGDPDVDESIILKWILEEWVVNWKLAKNRIQWRAVANTVTNLGGLS